MKKIRTLFLLLTELPLKVLFVKARGSLRHNNIFKRGNRRATAETGEACSSVFIYKDMEDADAIDVTYRPSLFVSGEMPEINREKAGEEVAALILDNAQSASNHVFNLLGSGPLNVNFDVAAPGIEGVVYKMGASGEAEKIKDKMFSLCEELSLFKGEHGLLVKERLKKYEPIDWHIDFKSGYRWNTDVWYKDVPIGLNPGADIKVPWELSRFHHGLYLGLANRLENGQDLKWGIEFVLQVLDWVVSNPVQYGVNWCCTMDVAIRAINWLWGWALFEGHPVLTPAFKELLAESLYQHGCHIENNLEYVGRGYNSNHYIANLAGLIYIGAALPFLKDSDRWLLLGLKEMIQEMKHQVYNDGVYYESSTSYHRLAAEMFLSCTLLVLGLSDERKERLKKNDKDLGNRGRVLFNSDAGKIFPVWYFKKLERMIEFTCSLLKDDGTVPQFGDNDSGRLHPFIPCCDRDQRHLLAVGGEIWGRKDWLEKGNGFSLEAALLLGLSRGKGRVEGSGKNRRNKPFIYGNSSSFINNIYSKAKGKSVLNIEVLTEDKSSANSETEFICYPKGGIFIYKNTNYHFSIACGSNGMGGIGAHAHNDKLSFELNVLGKDFIVDGGSYLYSPFPEVRNDFRSTRAHNTLLIDGREQNEMLPGYLFTLPDRAKAKIILADKDKFAGYHQGYGFVHYREVLFSQKNLEVVDILAREASAFIVLNLHPDVEIERKDERTLYLNNDGIIIKLDFQSLEGLKIESGFYSEGYGLKIESKRLIVSV